MSSFQRVSTPAIAGYAGATVRVHEAVTVGGTDAIYLEDVQFAVPPDGTANAGASYALMRVTAWSGPGDGSALAALMLRARAAPLTEAAGVAPGAASDDGSDGGGSSTVGWVVPLAVICGAPV